MAGALDRHKNAIGLGIALMLLGDFMFSANDVLGKWLVATYSVGQVLLIRSAAALVVMAPMVARQGVRSLVVVEKPWVQVLRVIFSTFEVIIFYVAVMYLPIADVMTFYLAAPIWVAALSPFFLGERVGWRRWTAIVIGFVGVVVALEPSSESLSFAALISIIGSLFFAMMIIQSRILRATPDTTLVFWQTFGALVAGIVLAPFDWVTPTPFDAALLAGLGIIAMLAHILINRSLKLAPAAVVAPFQYTLLVWAILFGWLVFGDVPKLSMLLGAVIIVGAGIFIFERQKKVAAGPAEGDLQDLV
ncbi:DMT family transporter [Chthonobacter albigriseus]|uniref:DMT family transporter n=1 Tax=Chthonobacter albigriseus TaxID=1683161 RepID=UPI0015EFB20A|nr:DMT family transporter [Chthonobacter albigriseus]